jgi:hypothetical protein
LGLRLGLPKAFSKREIRFRIRGISERRGSMLSISLNSRTADLPALM